MNMFQNIMERLRPLVGLKGWDYCVLWKLSEDQRHLELMECCCGGTENTEDPVFSVVLSCRDIIFQHPTTKSCELLEQLPSSIPLDSGIHAEALISNQPRWLNISSSSDSSVLEGNFGTRALIPLPGGLLELFVTKQVPEDEHVIHFVTTQCSILIGQEELINSTNMDTSFGANVNMICEEQSKQFLADHDNLNLPYDISADRIHLCSPPMNFLQQFTYSNDQDMNTNTENKHMKFMEPSSAAKKENDDKDSIKNENGRSDSISDCSDQIDDENDAKYRKRTGTGPPAKNLKAERRRRKRLNDRLYDLRALVPKITNLKKAAILGDAIEFVKEMQKQVKELEDELEEHSDDDQGVKNGIQNGIAQEIPNQNGDIVNGFQLGSSEVVSCSKLDHKSEISHDKGQQMEVQVEVAQLNGNEFFVKVFCEHKAGGFMKLMEALDSLGLEVTNATVTSFRGLVSNVFRVEKKDSEMIQADYVRESLLELTRDPIKIWSEIANSSENGTAMSYHHRYHHMHNGDLNSHLHHLHN